MYKLNEIKLKPGLGVLYTIGGPGNGLSLLYSVQHLEQ